MSTLFNSCILAIGVTVGSLSPSIATTLTDALIQAYQTNPSLKVGQSGLRATDEAVKQAKGALLPTVSGNISVDRNFNGSNGTEARTNGASITTTVPIYAGGTGKLAIEKARYNVLATRQSLKATEQTVLLDAVTAYMDVRRDQKNVQLAINSVKVLEEEVRAARERFEVGEVTRTDVSQAESRLAASESSLELNRAALKRSINAYKATVGTYPKNLRTPPASPKSPNTANAAESIAIAKHPSLLQQQFLVNAAESDVQIARGNKLPTVSGRLTSSISNDNFDNFSSNGETKSNQVGIDYDQTFYRGGRLNSAERQALATLDQQKAQLQLIGLQIRQNVQSAYATWLASKATITARQKQVRAAKIAFEGTSEEAKLGARTTLDALNAEQELLQARSDLTAAIRDEYVNSYTLLATMGLLTVEHLNLGIPSYNPDVNYTKVNGTKKLGIKRLKLFDKIKKRSGY